VTRLSELPVDAILPEMIASLERTPNLVIEAPPGAGKTTRVPPALLGLVRGEVIVLEPRRIAARLAARRVAAEMGEEVGGTVGYQVRFEERTSSRTRLRFVTEGILTRRLISDPGLRGVDAVVLDEFHERHLEGDLALALLQRLQRMRPQLRLIVMSATLDAAPIARYLGDCPILRSEGRMFPLSVRHLPYSPALLHVQVRGAVEMLQAEQSSGNILTFLPGAAEIRRAARECDVFARHAGLLVLPLHGDLSPAEQDRAVLPSAERKLILATNVAESSVTVEGVSAVIDSGLSRVATYSPWTGLPTLQISRISKASATQRTGRAGRTGPGRVLRLYPEEDFLLRSEHDLPEIQRADLSQLLLTLRAMKLAHLGDVAWLDAPPREAVEIAESVLDRMGAKGEMVERMTRFPLHPRLSRIVVEAIDRGVAHDGCRAAAMLALGARAARDPSDARGPDANDLLAALDRPASARLREHTQQLLRLARPAHPVRHHDDELLLSVLSGFSDRVARRRAGRQLLLSTGVAAELAGEPPASEFVMALDAEDRKENALPLVRLVARVEPEWLLELFPDRVEERTTVEWNPARERVEQLRSLLFDKLVLEESRGNTTDPEAAALLARKVMEKGVEQFADREALDQLGARVAFAGIEAADMAAVVRDLCGGLHSFGDFREAAKNLLPLLEQQSNPRVLAQLAPTSIRLPGGRQVKIHYESGRPPWIASRLQDFFGIEETPRIGPERTPLVIHLLAPNHRAVQTTTDLAGFWERLYPQVRRELMRRYPRHAWPEDPRISAK
jgi:ATP-dependent helicase HrpB